jgi:PAS domain-containing protein
MLAEDDGSGFNPLVKSYYPFIIINDVRTVKYVNPAFERLAGYSSHSIIGIEGKQEEESKE